MSTEPTLAILSGTLVQGLPQFLIPTLSNSKHGNHNADPGCSTPYFSVVAVTRATPLLVSKHPRIYSQYLPASSVDHHRFRRSSPVG
jgi:hypothetical protein